MSLLCSLPILLNPNKTAILLIVIDPRQYHDKLLLNLNSIYI